MALFVDGSPSEPQELSQYESSIVETASTEGIDLVTKGTVAATELQIELERFLLRVGSGRNVSIQQVVVTEALRRWHILQTIALTYRDAYHQQLNERYQHKLKAYEALSSSAAELLFDVGVGIAYAPLHRPERPELGQAIGDHAANIWIARVSWINAQGTESEASRSASYATEHGSALTVTTAAAPANAVAWNVYVGTREDSLTKQNTVPLALADGWTMPAEGLRSGPAPSTGQRPDTLLRWTSTILRG